MTRDRAIGCWGHGRNQHSHSDRAKHTEGRKGEIICTNILNLATKYLCIY